MPLNVAPDALRKETAMTLSQINAVIEEIRRQCMAADQPIEPSALQDRNGGYILAPLLCAKAQCLNTLTLLNQPIGRRGG